MSVKASADASTLWDRIKEVYQTATSTGAAQGINTTQTIVEDTELGINFVIFVADSLNKKPKAPARTECAFETTAHLPSSFERLKSRLRPQIYLSSPTDLKTQGTIYFKAVLGRVKNPFLPYDENLWVQHLSDTHTLLLNKFNLVAHHVLVVTRAFESQDNRLNSKDLSATWRALQAFPEGGLAYFNHGPASGMSMPHKHLQIVPLPIGPSDADTRLPTGPILEAAIEGKPVGEVTEVRKFPFRAYACRVDDSIDGQALEAAYLALVEAAGIDHAASPISSYSFQLTRRWMLLVPRTAAEAPEGVGCNTVGYAGSLFVKSEEQVQTMKDVGPCQLLTKMAEPW